MVLFDLEVVLGFAGQLRRLGGVVGRVAGECGRLERRVTDSCVGGFVRVFEEKMGDVVGTGRFLEEELSRVAGGPERSGYEAEGLLSHIVDYAALGFLAVQANVGGVRRLGDVFDVVVSGIASNGKIQADTDVLREVARGLRAAPSEITGVVSSCESVYEDYRYRGGRLVPVYGVEELFMSIRLWARDFETLADWLDKKTTEFEETQQGALTTPHLTRLTSARTEYVDPWGRGDEREDFGVLDGFLRGVGEGLKGDVSLVAGILGLAIPDAWWRPYWLNGPEDDLVQGVSAFVDDPLGALDAMWDSIVESFSTPEGAAEFTGSMVGGFGAAGLAAYGLRSLSKINKFHKHDTPDPHPIDDINIKGNWKESRPDYGQYQKIYDNPKYFDQETGEIKWPGEHGDPNTNGFLNGVYYQETLHKGTIIDRYGKPERGEFLAPDGLDFSKRSLPPWSETGTQRHRYKVIEEFDVNSGEIAPWFDQPGGGTQYQIFKDLVPDAPSKRFDVKWLKENGYLEEID